MPIRRESLKPPSRVDVEDTLASQSTAQRNSYVSIWL